MGPKVDICQHIQYAGIMPMKRVLIAMCMCAYIGLSMPKCPLNSKVIWRTVNIMYTCVRATIDAYIYPIRADLRA